MPTTVIVGASVAGVRVATELRRLGHPNRLVLVDEQDELPYDRPPLSKDMLVSDDAAARPLLSTADAHERDIELRLGLGAISLDPDRGEVLLCDGTATRYDTLVIATGARPRPLPWSRTDRVLELRTIADGRRLHAALRTSRTMVVIGAGFIGAEVASAARSMGLDVTLVDPAPVPMARLFGVEIGERFTALHTAYGATTRFGTGVTAIENRPGSVEVHLTDGSTLSCDLVVAGIGVLPNTEWLASSGIPLDNGVVCNSSCQVETPTLIYAAGDVARWHHPRHAEHVRVEHWTNAVEQAQYVAKAIAGRTNDTGFAPVEYVWSDQYQWKVQLAGRPERGVEHRVVGVDDRFAVIYTDAAGSLCGVLAVNWPKACLLARRTLATDTPGFDLFTKLADIAS